MSGALAFLLELGFFNKVLVVLLMVGTPLAVVAVAYEERVEKEALVWKDWSMPFAPALVVAALWPWAAPALLVADGAAAGWDSMGIFYAPVSELGPFLVMVFFAVAYAILAWWSWPPTWAWAWAKRPGAQPTGSVAA